MSSSHSSGAQWRAVTRSGSASPEQLRPLTLYLAQQRLSIALMRQRLDQNPLIGSEDHFWHRVLNFHEVVLAFLAHPASRGSRYVAEAAAAYLCRELGRSLIKPEPDPLRLLLDDPDAPLLVERIINRRFGGVSNDI